jgi:hypothetical protein
MRLILACCFVANLSGCGGGAGAGSDAAARDLSAIADLSPAPDLIGMPARLCSTAQCAASPCTADCVFAPPQNGACGGQAAAVDTAKVIACTGFCGFLKFPGYGCLRFKSEVAQCNHECWPWSDPQCLDWTPKGDYQAGGAICNIANGYFCDSGPAADGGVPCDM